MSFSYNKPPDNLSSFNSRPSLVEVVEQSGVHLRRAGKELVGLCPFHDEKTPSFYVNPTKEVEVFYCHGCGAKGDVFGYVMQIQGVDFKGALAHLGLAGTSRRLKPMKSPERIAAEVMVAWAKKTSLALSFRMRLLARGMDGEKGPDELCNRQWNILEVLDDDLANAVLLPELWKQRNIVEGIVHGC